MAIWAGLVDDRASFFTPERSRKVRSLRAEPRVEISLGDHRDPYATGWLRGRVVPAVTGRRRAS